MPKIIFLNQILLFLFALSSLANSTRLSLNWESYDHHRENEVRAALIDSGIFGHFDVETIKLVEMTTVDEATGKTLLLCYANDTNGDWCFFAAITGLTNTQHVFTELQFVSIGKLHKKAARNEQDQCKLKELVKHEGEIYAQSERAFKEVWKNTSTFQTENCVVHLQAEIEAIQSEYPVKLRKYWVCNTETVVAVYSDEEKLNWGFSTFVISETGIVTRKYFDNLTAQEVYSTIAMHLANPLAFYCEWKTDENSLKAFSTLDAKLDVSWVSDSYPVALYAVTECDNGIMGSIHIYTAIYPAKAIFAVWEHKAKKNRTYLRHVSAPCKIEEAATLYRRFGEFPFSAAITYTLYGLSQLDTVTTEEILNKAELMDTLKKKIIEKKPSLIERNVQLSHYSLLPTTTNKIKGCGLHITCGCDDGAAKFYVFVITNPISKAVEISFVSEETASSDEVRDHAIQKLNRMYSEFYTDWKEEDLDNISEEMTTIANSCLLPAETTELTAKAVFTNGKKMVIIAKHNTCGHAHYVYIALSRFGDAGKLKVTSVGPEKPYTPKKDNEPYAIRWLTRLAQIYMDKPFAFAEDWIFKNDNCTDNLCENLLVRWKVTPYKEVRIFKSFEPSESIPSKTELTFTVIAVIVRANNAKVATSRAFKTILEAIDQMSYYFLIPSMFIENPTYKKEANMELLKKIELESEFSWDNFVMMSYGLPDEKNAILAFDNKQENRGQSLIFTEYSEASGEYLKIGQTAYFNGRYSEVGIEYRLFELVVNPLTFKLCNIFVYPQAEGLPFADEQKIKEKAPWVCSIGLGISVYQQRDFTNVFPGCVLETWSAEVPKGQGASKEFFVVWKRSIENSPERLLYISALNEWRNDIHVLADDYSLTPLAFQETNFVSGIAWYDSSSIVCQEQMKALQPLIRKKENLHWTLSDKMYSRWKFGRIVALPKETLNKILTYCLLGEVEVKVCGTNYTKYISVIVQMKDTPLVKELHHISFGQVRDIFACTEQDISEYVQRRLFQDAS